VAIDGGPKEQRFTRGDLSLVYFEHNQPHPDQPSLLFAHCTGFHARVWDRIIEAFPHHHTLALDQRGHGRSDKQLITTWRTFGDDIAALLEHLGLRRVIGIGHSVGGHAMTSAAAISTRIARLVLCDPTIAAPDAYVNPKPRMTGEVHPAANRRRFFSSAQAMHDQLQPKGSYALFEPRMFWDYCQHGLLPAMNGGFTLACPPEVEASVYAASRSNSAIYDSVAAVDRPVMVLRAMSRPGRPGAFDFASSPTWPGLANAFPNGRELHLPDCTHFIPMQMPDRVIEVIADEIAAWTVACP